MNKAFLALRRGFRLRKGAGPLCVVSLLIVSVFFLLAAVGAQNDPQTATSLDFSMVRNCPEGIELRLPSRVVLQYIDGVFHKWEEHDLDAGGGYCIVLRKPEQRRLSAGEAKTLLENSARWREQATPAGSSQTLPPDDPRFQRPAVEPKEFYQPQRDSGPVFPEPDKPAQPGYPAKEPRSAIQQERIALQKAEDVVGTDDRIRVTDTTSYPWNTVGFIGNTYPDTYTTRGTGAIVGPYMVLTAGHMVYGVEHGGYVDSLFFIPGQRQLSEDDSIVLPYGQFTAVRWETNQQYIDTLNSFQTDPNRHFNYDYAAVFFNRPFTSVGLTTYMPLSFDVAPSSINLAGYPKIVQGEADSKSLWRSYGEVTGVDERMLYYDADTTGGNSGGPVWEYRPSDSVPRRIVAVHVSARPGGCRLVRQNQNVIETWMQWVPPSSGGDSGGGCFIATAAYGSYLDPSVQTLRNFRDHHLLTNGPGRAFVSLYNSFSPPAAALIRGSVILRTASRMILTPMVYAIRYPAAFSSIFILAIILGIALAYRRRSCRRQSPIIIKG